MSITLRNRLSGKHSEDPQSMPVFGLWQILNPEGETFLNSVNISHSDFLVPDITGQWSLITKGGGNPPAGNLRKLSDAGDFRGIQHKDHRGEA
ncbi:hypothetical protein ACFL4N_04035 [Thermodesulfobacteriota bacterium]